MLSKREKKVKLGGGKKGQFEINQYARHLCRCRKQARRRKVAPLCYEFIFPLENTSKAFTLQTTASKRLLTLLNIGNL